MFKKKKKTPCKECELILVLMRLVFVFAFRLRANHGSSVGARLKVGEVNIQGPNGRKIVLMLLHSERTLRLLFLRCSFSISEQLAPAHFRRGMLTSHFRTK